jgi:hypothetical protein
MRGLGETGMLDAHVREALAIWCMRGMQLVRLELPGVIGISRGGRDVWYAQHL